MGAKHPKQVQELTPEILHSSFTTIINNQGESYNKQDIIIPIKTILHFLRQTDPIHTIQGLTGCNPEFLDFVFHENFPKQMAKLLRLLTTVTEQISQKSLSFLKVSQVQDLTAITDFILYFSNLKILNAFDSLIIRTDVTDETKNQLKLLKQKFGQIEVNGNMVEKLEASQKQQVEKTLRVTLIKMINLRQKTWSRSESDLKYFAFLEQSLFMLYAKLYFAQKREWRVPDLNQHFKSNMIIGGYFLATGSSFALPSLYETASIFIYSFLKLEGIQWKEVKNLPDHLFKNLPIIRSRTIYEYIVSYVLFTLKYVQEGDQVYVRFPFNRINSLKLVELIIKKGKLANKTITYFLEELCLQVKAGQIQRAYIYEIISDYCAIDENNSSEILKTFLASKNLKYSLKYNNKKIKISQKELLTELDDDADSYQKEYFLTSHKFVLERILFRNVVYNFNDRLLWNEILPEIFSNAEDYEQDEEGSSLRKGSDQIVHQNEEQKSHEQNQSNVQQENPPKNESQKKDNQKQNNQQTNENLNNNVQKQQKRDQNQIKNDEQNEITTKNEEKKEIEQNNKKVVEQSEKNDEQPKNEEVVLNEQKAQVIKASDEEPTRKQPEVSQNEGNNIQNSEPSTKPQNY